MLGIDRRAARYTWTAALILLLLCLLYLVRTTLFVFIVALLFAYLLSPLVNVIDRLLPTSRTRTPALAVAYLIFIAALYVAVTQIGARIFEQANSFGKSVPALLATWQQPSKTASPAVNSFKAQIIQKVREQVSKSSGDIIAAIPRAGVKILSVASNLIFVVIVPVLGFFFLKDGRAIALQFVEMVEDGPRRSLLDDLLADTSLLLAHYMRAILLLSLAAFTAYSIFFTILRIPYSFLLAALAGTLEFIPMIGPLTAGATILIVTGVSGGPLLSALIFLIVYRMFADYLLSPQLMRAGVKLHPLFVLFGVFAGAEIAGIPGAFLSVPVLAIIRIFYRRIRQVRVLARRPAVKPVLTP
jgi:predicted PurR-regulated permease PerM